MSAQKSIKRLFAIIVLGNLILAAFVFLGAPDKKPKPLPTPNAFDVFQKASALLPSADYSAYKSLNIEALSALTSNAAPALTILRQGLTNQSRVPLEFTTAYSQQAMVTLSAFKQLGLALAAEGRLAELQDRTNDAATVYLDIINFAQKSSQDSVMVFKMAGVGIESLGQRHLQTLANSLDSPNSRQIVKGLESINSEEPSAEENLRQEAHWISKTYGWTTRLTGLLAFRQTQKVRAHFKQKVEANQLARRQLFLTFAAHAYQLDHGKPPTSTADLLPNYLKAIPVDPTTGTNLVLQPTR